ncbi:hypothetical protein RJT34_14648 [Clitoria ternatea]|uniref:Bet v I/Major latex protein domain-containing protein n=1 Tax=Clitoria ternatea TaxID=43366 RepID=A0AAN9JQR7_CLITE
MVLQNVEIGLLRIWVPRLGYVKHKVDVLDPKNYVYHYTIVEGDVLLDPLEKISYEYKSVANPDGGTTTKSTVKYYTKGDAQLTQEFLQANKERSAGFTKAIEDYLLANLDYN